MYDDKMLHSIALAHISSLTCKRNGEKRKMQILSLCAVRKKENERTTE